MNEHVATIIDDLRKENAKLRRALDKYKSLLTQDEQREILSYIRWRFSDDDEPDWENTATWLVDLEKCRRALEEREWTSVDDLPKKVGYYLTIDDDSRMSVTFFNPRFYLGACFEANRNLGIPASNVTHWMPRPETPMEKNE